MTNAEIGFRISSRRKELNMTMDDLAQKVGVAKSTIQRYEAGKIEHIKMPVIESVANALSVNPCWLIGKSEDKACRSQEPEHDILDDIDVAFYGDYKVLDDHDKEMLRDMARVMREWHEKKKK